MTMYMTPGEYSDLWNSSFAPHCVGIEMPSYEDYRQRERMLADYLDIFKGINTRDSGISMPYDHPFIKSDGSHQIKETPLIKYILIGEAPPVINHPNLIKGCANPGGDSANSYFYNIRHLKQTNWLSSPRLNWNCPDYRPCPENKINCLHQLALKGVLLMDLFPFAIRINSSLREKLNQHGTTSYFWDNAANPYNLASRIDSIAGFLDQVWDLSLVAPYLISEYIVNPSNGIQPLKTLSGIKHAVSFRQTYPDSTRMKNSPWKKIAISGGGSPSQHLIGISFI